MIEQLSALARTGPRSADDGWPVLQRVRWRFVLLNLVGCVLAPLSLTRVAADPDARVGLYLLLVASLAAWTVVLYRGAAQPLLVRGLGPVLVGGIGVAAGDYSWAFGTLFMALFLHSLYGGRGQVLRTALGYYVAYETAVLVTAGVDGLRSSQLLSMAIAVVVMSLVLGEMGALLRRSDETRSREDIATAAARDLLRATGPEEVARAAVAGVVSLVAAEGGHPQQVSLWRREHGRVSLAWHVGGEPQTRHVQLDALPESVLAGYLGNGPVRLTPDTIREVQAALGTRHDPSDWFGLAVPLSDGVVPTGGIVVTTASPLSEDLAGVIERFADEVSLADRAARRNELLTGVLANSADGIVLVDHAGVLAFVSPAIDELAGRDVAVGTPLGALLHVVDVDRPVAGLDDLALHADGLVIARPDGARREVEVSIRPVPGEGTVLNVRDVSRQRQLQEEIRYRAYHDAVTGLPNRARFLERLETALGDALLRSDGRVAVALLDLDDFKAINDARGHLAGDRVLCEVAARVSARVRTGDTFARIGGDEFALLLDDVDARVDVAALVSDVLGTLEQPFVLDGQRVRVRASCGVVVSTGDRTAEEMLGNADIAMYAGKADDRGTVVLFDAALREELEERRSLKDDLEMGIARDELRLHYQPVLALATQDVVGVEALVRWQHPERGLLLPDRFVPVAEESGLVDALGSWVLLTALRDLAAWSAEGIIGPAFQMHVNISAHQLGDPSLVADVRTALQVLGVDPTHLVIEITETALAADPDLAEQTLCQLARLGIGIAIDDFGTGYASFTYLRRFPVGIVKIDRSFVTDVADGPEQSALARAIVRLAQSLGMTTVAEGIEDEASRVLLERWGCDHGQGWLWARALPAHELTPWLRRQATAPVAGFLAT